MKPADCFPAMDGSAEIPCALLASGNEEDRETLDGILAQCGLRPLLCSTVREAELLLASAALSMVFCEYNLSGGGYFHLLRSRSSWRRVPVVVCSSVVDTRLYLDAMDMGAYDFMVRPYRRADVAWIVRGAVQQRAEVSTVAARRGSPSGAAGSPAHAYRDEAQF